MSLRERSKDLSLNMLLSGTAYSSIFRLACPAGLRSDSKILKTMFSESFISKDGIPGKKFHVVITVPDEESVYFQELEDGPNSFKNASITTIHGIPVAEAIKWSCPPLFGSFVVPSIVTCLRKAKESPKNLQSRLRQVIWPSLRAGYAASLGTATIISILYGFDKFERFYFGKAYHQFEHWWYCFKCWTLLGSCYYAGLNSSLFASYFAFVWFFHVPKTLKLSCVLDSKDHLYQL